MVFTVTNVGLTGLPLDQLRVSGSGSEFIVDWGDLNGWFEAGDSASVTVAFAPYFDGERWATLEGVLHADDALPGMAFTIAVHGVSLGGVTPTPTPEEPGVDTAACGCRAAGAGAAAPGVLALLRVLAQRSRRRRG
jgi:hypothetical protein